MTAQAPAGSTYYYLKNAQGDVLGIVNASGTQVVAYTYDAWGKVLTKTGSMAATLGSASPFRYRGYVYDEETELYYLQSRYYNPSMGRFINADSNLAGVGGDVLGYNLFAYCHNNPVNMSDSTGHWPQWIKNAVSAVSNAVKKAVNAVVSAIKSVASSISNASKLSRSASNRWPNNGNPGSTYTAPNGDTRTYGPDGNPARDWDHDDHGQPDKHPHDSNGGHNHDWDWSKTPPRGPAYADAIEPIIGVAIVTVCVIGIAAVAADDATGIGIADDFLLGPLGAGAGKGLIMIFG